MGDARLGSCLHARVCEGWGLGVFRARLLWAWEREGVSMGKDGSTGEGGCVWVSVQLHLVCEFAY